MKKTPNSQSKGAEIDFPSIETYLGSTLRPIQPRANFVTSLRSRLEVETRTKHVGLSMVQYLILALIALASTALLVLTGARAIAALIGALGVLRLAKGQAQKKDPSSMAPA